MLDRRVLRWCGLAAVVAGVVGLLILIKNLLHFMEHHPKSRHASHDANLETELETISDSFTWLLTNYAEGIVAGLVLVGAVGILASMRDEPSRSWARIAIPAVVAGSVVYGLTIANHVALERAADEYLENVNDAHFAVAESIAFSSGQLWTSTLATLFGLTAVLVGVTTLSGGTDARWVGYAAVVGGILCLVSATFYHFESYGFMTRWPSAIGRALFWIWLLVTGWRAWKESGEAPQAVAT